MHEQAFEFIRRMVIEWVPEPSGLKVLDIGSYNVNGSIRVHLFGSNIFGIDVREGPDVDLVIDAVEYDGGESYDVVVCAETLEHAPDPESVIDSAWRALKPGGVFILTAAGVERIPHNVNGDHGAEAMGDEHYGNIAEHDLAKWLHRWREFRIELNPDYGDIYAVAVKR